MTIDRRYLYLAVFFSGMTSLAVELSASRLLGNVFGTSNLVWACIIGLILIYLTLGYYIGGKWADRSPHPRTFYTILVWAAFTVGLVPVVSHPVLQVSAQAFDQLQMGILFGSFAAVLILFIIPVTLLGTASPFAIRLAITEPAEAGRISGRIYAISTLGSFIGTFLPVLVLIPTIGTFRTFVAFSALLLLVALVGLGRSAGWRSALVYVWMPLALLVLAWIGIRGPYKTTSGLIYETESAYNYIQVLQSDGYTMLRLNDGQGIHSIYSPKELDFHGPWEQVLAASFFNPAPYDPGKVKSMAILGLAAGTTARQATSVYGPIPIDGYEIDPEIIEVGRKYFDMNEPNLNAIVADGRWGLEHSTKRYQIISVDAYRPPYIPWHMTTREFFEIVRDHLTEDGALAINVGRSTGDRSLIDALGTTIRSVFPSVYVVDIPNTFNSMIYATMQPTTSANLGQNLAYLTQKHDTSPLLLEVISTAMMNLQDPPKHTIVFTDDRAPIEWITNAMVIRFIISGEVEELQ
ncbi:MAG: fused MFS/spermidine synthase [Chloroflexi bacterium]|nr:fused MFS/spermidine synthase [Chloroflexota bacterium]